MGRDEELKRLVKGEDKDIDDSVFEEWLLDDVKFEPAEINPIEVVKDDKEQVQAVVYETKPVEEEKVEITEYKLEKLFENYLVKQGLQRRYVVAFELPTEYKGCKTETKEEKGAVIEIRKLNNNTAKFRTLRKKFYNVLHRYAWNSPIGWILRSDVNPSELSTIIDELNKLAGTHRVIELVEVYLPVRNMVEWLSNWITKVRMDYKYFVEKLKEAEEGSKEAKRLTKRLYELKDELEKLERELEVLQSLGMA